MGDSRQWSDSGAAGAVCIAARVNRPDLIILDEPTLGLDPLIQREFRDLVADAMAGGATLFLFSHLLSGVELICDRIGLIRDEWSLRVGSLNELRALRVHRVEAVFIGRLDAADLAVFRGQRISGGRSPSALCGAGFGGAAAVGAVRCGRGGLDSHELSLEEVFLGGFDQPPEPARPAG